MPIGLQLYTVRDHLEKDLEGTLQRVAEIGYKVVELGSFDFYGKRPAELRRILTGLGLTVISMHFTESQLKSDLEKHIAEAKECGITYLGLASLDEQDRKSLEAVKRDAEWFNQIGKSVARTDPKLVNFELDCFWCVRAGKDPVGYFHRYPGRFPQLHIKDLKPGYPPTTGEGPPAFTEVGQGVIDWKKIFKAARGGDMKHFYVEQDECDRDSLESAKISYTYLHNLTV
jgi:sugar phosphate isomerase/epimerase